MFFDNTVAAATPQHELADQLQGDLFLPETPGYDEARLAWNRAVDQYPALIVVAHGTADVVAAVRYADAHALKIAVQSTGHGVHRAADGALLIVTARMTDVQVNVTAQTAWVEAGAEWGMVLEKTQAVGLAPLLGSSPNVGVIGYTLGGGMGWLARQYGLATDSVQRFEVVTADGEVRTVSRSEHPDLFWGLRGGGGSLAIITSVEMQLYPVTTVYGGNLIYPASMAREVILRYREWIKDAPDALTSSFAIMNFPPIPAVPDFLRGKSVIMVRGCYTGSVEAGEALIRPWLEWQAPLANLFGPLPFSQVAMISNDPLDPMPAMSSGAWLRELSDAAIDTIVRYALPHGDAPVLTMTEVRHAGGAISRVPMSESPIGHRDATHVLLLVAATPTPEAHHHASAYAIRFKEELQPALDGIYLNFLDGPEARTRTRDAYALESYLWLRRLKVKYDAQDRFCHSFDIRPLQS
ncbi:MAG: FAD-binding oxidoreductase [Caldilineaceae bacterium]|nr:FAD-binding oxidoreductase [Caldilineaceae bacterium]